MEQLLALKDSAENGPENKFNFRVACLLSTLTGTPVDSVFMANCANEMDVASIQEEMRAATLNCCDIMLGGEGDIA